MPRGRKKKDNVNKKELNETIENFNEITNPIQNDNKNIQIKEYEKKEVPVYLANIALDYQQLQTRCNQFEKLGYEVINVSSLHGALVILARIKE